MGYREDTYWNYLKKEKTAHQRTKIKTRLIKLLKKLATTRCDQYIDVMVAEWKIKLYK